MSHWLKGLFLWRSSTWILIPFPCCTHDDEDNDERNDDVLMTVVKIMITITAVSSLMHNSVCSNWIHAMAGEKIHFRSECCAHSLFFIGTSS